MIDEIIGIVREAGKRTMEIYEKDFSVKEKEDKSPVTEADLASEKILIAGLKSFGFGICSEEDGVSGSGDKMWVIDPLDGTMDFIQKTGEFSIMVGLLENGKPIMGIVYAPAIDLLYYAEAGKGSFIVEKDKEPRKINVSAIDDASRFRMVISRNHFRQNDKDVALRLGIETFKGLGSVGVKYGEIAKGDAEICIYQTQKLGLWDCCAPHVILKEAGGEVFGMSGKDPIYDFTTLKMADGFIGTNGTNKDDIIRSIKEGQT